MHLTIAIVSYNTRDFLDRCLRSLPYDSREVSIEAIVVDNGSEDGSAEMAAAEFPQAVVLTNSENVGFVRANNQGLQAATGDFLFMLKPDTEVREGCIERLMDAVASDDAIGAVGPRLLNTDASHQTSFGPFPRLIYRLFPSRFETRYEKRIEQEVETGPLRVAQVDWLAGAALLCQRDVLETVGPLDERYFMWYDDLDWCQKLRRAGYKRLFVSDAVVVHHGRQSGAKLEDPALQRQLFDSEYTYLRLHGGPAVTWLAYGTRVAKGMLTWMTVGRGDAREAARAKLSYHWRRFRRFCLHSPPRADWGLDVPRPGGRNDGEER